MGAYEVDPLILSGLKGIFRHANLAKDNLDETRSEPGAHDTHGGALSQLSSVGDMLSYWAYSNTTAFTNAVHNYRHGLQAAISELASVKGNRVKYSQALLNNIFN